MRFLLLVALSGFAMASASISVKPFGKSGGKDVHLFTLTNKGGMKAEIMTYGATVISLTAPDRDGKFEDVVCGYSTLAEYEKASPYFGCIVGRYGNRIAKGQFKLDGKTYKLAQNNGPNSLHGGNKGFDKRIWSAAVKEAKGVQSVVLTYISRDGEEGYPGRLTSKVTYSLTDSNVLRIDYEVKTDAPTVANLTHHGYFNLAGADARDCLDHVMMINADRYTPVDSTLIPTGKLPKVDGTPFDFRKPTAIGARIDMANEQLKFGKGYDHNWVLNGKQGTMRRAVRVSEPTSGRIMEVWTTEPGVQFYSGNFLDGSNIGKGGKVYPHRFAFCLETQRFPDSPNQAKFPTTVLRPGQVYRSRTDYRFSAR